MAFYAHPYFAAPRATSPSPAPFHGSQSHPFSHRYHHQHPYHFTHHHPEEAPRHSASPYSTHSLDEEERLAYAHLQSIQRRREAEQASIQREAAARHHAQQQREAALARVLEVERQREAAIRQAIAEENRRERERELLARREQAIQTALRERERHVQQELARRLQVREAQAIQARQAEERRRQKYIEALQAGEAQQEARAREHRYIEHALAKRNACAKRCAAHAAQAEKVKKGEDKEEDVEGLEALNSLFGSLFGINIVNDKRPDTSANAQQSTTPTEASATAPAAAKASESKPVVEQETLKEEVFPEAINDILSHFLGLRVDPASTSPNGLAEKTPGDNKVPEGLNELLGHFGLVFEPTDANDTDNKDADTAPVDAQKSAPDSTTPAAPEVEDPPEAPLPVADVPTTAQASSSTSRPGPSASKVEQTPLTAFLDNAAHLPPFVRDILGNVELAFKEQAERKKEEVKVEGKGKGVAEGEKKSRSAPAPAPAPTTAPPADTSPTATTPSTPAENTTTSLDQLSAIEHDLYLLTESFTFPPTLSFSNTSPADSAPALLFDRTNSPYHAQTHKLLQLLLAADSVSSQGDRAVRQKRKALVKRVEGEIERLEAMRDEVWAGVKAKRESGEVQEVDEKSWSGSESGSESEVESEGGMNKKENKSGSRAASVVDEEEELAREIEGFMVGEPRVEQQSQQPATSTPASVSAQATTSTATNDEPTTVSGAEHKVASSASPTSAEAGTDQPKTFADAAKAHVQHVEHVEVDKAKEVEGSKEEGYELL